MNFSRTLPNDQQPNVWPLWLRGNDRTSNLRILSFQCTQKRAFNQLKQTWKPSVGRSKSFHTLHGRHNPQLWRCLMLCCTYWGQVDIVKNLRSVASYGTPMCSFSFSSFTLSFFYYFYFISQKQDSQTVFTLASLPFVLPLHNFLRRWVKSNLQRTDPCTITAWRVGEIYHGCVQLQWEKNFQHSFAQTHRTFWRSHADFAVATPGGGAGPEVSTRESWLQYKARAYRHNLGGYTQDFAKVGGGAARWRGVFRSKHGRGAGPLHGLCETHY